MDAPSHHVVKRMAELDCREKESQIQKLMYTQKGLTVQKVSLN